MIDENCGPNAFAMRVLNASMEPRFREDDMLIIDPDVPVEPGDFVLAVMAQGSRIKSVLGRYQEGPVDGRQLPAIRLARINPKFPAIKMTPDEGSVVGRVVRHISVL